MVNAFYDIVHYPRIVLQIKDTRKFLVEVTVLKFNPTDDYCQLIDDHSGF